MRFAGARGVTWAAGALLALLMTAAPAAADGETSHSTFRGGFAFAAWFLSDALNTSVHMAVREGTSQTDGGRPVEEREAFVSVSQRFCDTATDELVFRSFFGNRAVGDAVVRIDRKLEEALVEGTFRLTGFEFRAVGCSAPEPPPPPSRPVEPPRPRPLGDALVDVRALWLASGDVVRERSDFRFDTGDTSFRSRSDRRVRPALATGSLSSTLDLLNLGSLGESRFAQMLIVRTMTIVRGEDPFPGPPRP